MVRCVLAIRSDALVTLTITNHATKMKLSLVICQQSQCYVLLLSLSAMVAILLDRIHTRRAIHSILEFSCFYSTSVPC